MNGRKNPLAKVVLNATWDRLPSSRCASTENEHNADEENEASSEEC
jgi:hypothetical protein